MTGSILKRYDNIIKSAEDKRLYRGLELVNRMKVLLVSDPTTDKSAAALDVNVGYLSDPDHIPGLAHFCEHMLFLGTKKYPNENDYSKFLSEHGGGSNAATYPDHTVYYFDVVPEHLQETLDRFAQFFITPLFTESATERELNAVNSEHEKNIASDVWRLDQLDKATCNPNHPYHKFGTGNKETLEHIPKEKGIIVRTELLHFHDTWYSSNIMALAILGKESLDELEEIVVTLFSGVKDKNVTAPSWDEHPFTKEQLAKRGFIVPIRDVRSLNVVFPMPYLLQYYKSAPGNYISHLVGHEGPGSLLSILKSRGWSNHLVAGGRPAPRGMGFFAISVDLTEEGMFHVNNIVKLIFQYLNMLKSHGPLEWIQEEQKQISSMIFRFKDKESPRSYIAAHVHYLHEYPIEEVLSAHFLLSEWEPAVITNLLNNFTPENVRVGVIAKKFSVEVNEKEPWYGTEYKLESISEDILQEWRRCGLCPDLHIPDKNDFVATNFDLYPFDKELTEHPTIVQDTVLTRVWFKQDDKYLLPKTNIMFDFVSPLAYLDPINCNLTHMFVQLFRDALNEYVYAAEIAGLKWELTNTKSGLVLALGGYTEKQHILLGKIIEKFTAFKIDPKRFEIFKENYIRSLKNFAMEQPYQHAVYYLTVLLSEHSWTKQELLDATELLTIERLEQFIPQMLSKMHIECLVHGSMNKKKALEMVDIVENRFVSDVNVTPLLPRQLLLNRELQLEESCDYLYSVDNKIHKSSCVEAYYQCGLQNTKDNILLELFAQIIQEPCFDILRTKEQLGYIVYSGIRKANGIHGLRIIVQSDKHPSVIDHRIEEFLNTMLLQLQNMTNEEFERHRDSLMAHRLEKPKQLTAQSNIFWNEITAQQYHFNRVEVEVAYLKTVTKEEVIKFYQKILQQNVKQRRKLAVHVLSKASGGAGTLKEIEIKEMPSTQFVIEDVTTFKSSHGMYPLVQPYINITRKGQKCKL
ncbi:hypothetical protein FQA39_LY18167 [Lamprigera yunnana]|nr:hypothetical protein FQA39_LY18167 [Lamprigera yunnana]